MKKIELTQGKTALVSDEDYEYLMQWKWHVYKATTGGWYAKRNMNKKEAEKAGKRRAVYMHRVIAERMGLDMSKFIDHNDRDSLNNCRSNLRSVTQKQNQENRGLQSKNKSGYAGVWFNKRSKKWVACLGHNKEKIHLGTYSDKEDAVKARKEAEKKYYTHSKVCG